MAINFAGYLFQDDGDVVSGATVQLLQVSDNAEEASTTTNSDGYWAFSEADQDRYYVKITAGTSVRYLRWADEISLKEIDVRNNEANTTPAATFTNLTNNASNQVAVFSGANTTRADDDEIYTSFKLANSAAELIEYGRMTVVAKDVTDGTEDGQIEFDVMKAGTLTKVWTITSSDAAAMSFDMNVDSLTIGSGADTDISLTFDANTADGVITWMEDEDYFKFSDEIFMNSTEKILFGDTATFIHQSSDGVMTVDGEATIDLNASTAVLVSNDLKLNSDSAVLGFGADNDTTLTHTDGTGLTLNSTNKLTFGDTGTFIHQSSDGVLTITSDTTVDINGAVALDGAMTGVTSIYTTDLIIGEDSQTAIDFGTANEIDFKVDNAARLTLTASALYPVTNNQIDLGTSSLEFKDAFFDGTVTADAFAGPLTGNVTGTADVATVATTVTITDNESTNEDNALIFTAGGDVDGGNLGLESDGTLTYNPSTGKVTATGFIGTLTGNVTGDVTGNVTGNTSGTAATVTTAAQTNITSLGTLTTLTVDDITINGSTISDAGNLEIDVDGDITIDANGGQINFKDNANTAGVVLNVASASNASLPSVARVGDSNTGMYFPADDTLGFVVNASEAGRFIEDGLLVGGVQTSALTVEANTSVATLQAAGLGNSACAIFSRWSDDTNGFRLKFLKSRATSVAGTPSSGTRPDSGDQIGQIWFGVDDGVDNSNVYANTSARIIGEVDGTVADNDTPGRLTFHTTTDGSGSTGERLRIDNTGSVLIGDTANANQTVGLTLNMGANDNEILTLKSSDVTHGMTGQTEADTFGTIVKGNNTQGMPTFTGYSSGTRGLQLVGNHTTDNTSQASDGNSAIMVRANLRDGTGLTSCASGANIFGVRNAGTVVYLIDGAGDVHYDGSTNAGAWDDYDDIALLDTVRAVTTNDYKGVFSNFTEEHTEVLDKTGVITMNDDGHHFISTKGLNGLMIDSIRQLSQRTQESLEELKEENKQLRQKLEALEV